MMRSIGWRRIVSVLLAFLLVDSFTCTVCGEPCQHGEVFLKNSSRNNQIALTFDDGPHPRYSKEILSILEEYGIKATFFIIGINAERYPEALKLIAQSGCEIGNHTYSHSTLKQRSPKEIQGELEACQRVIQQIIGIRPVLFRPPQGATSQALLNVSKKMSFDVVLWSIDTLDWELTPSKEIFRNVLNNVKGGDIILMHDYVSGGNTTCDALRLIIPQLLSKGYEFVTVSELLR